MRTRAATPATSAQRKLKPHLRKGTLQVMVVVSEGSVRVVAHELGVADTEACEAVVAGHVELALRRAVEAAAKFMRNARRQRMTTQDIDMALRLLGEKPVFVYEKPNRIRWKKDGDLFFVIDEDVDFHGLLGRKQVAAGGGAQKDALDARATTTVDMVDLEDHVPYKVSYGIHYLAIDGVQPTIDQNPRILQHESKEIPSSEKQDAISSSLRMAKGAGSSSLGDGEIANHVLSRELQLYFEKVVSAVVDSVLGNRGAAEAVYASLISDRGLQALMPYLSKFIFDQVNKSLSNLRLLQATIRLAKCILVNPNLDKEVYLHQLMPPILTCIVHRRLCSSPFQDHWSLRDLASSLIPIILDQYGELYRNLKPRITKTLHNALFGTDKKPMTTQYGALVGIASMGPLTVQSVLLPAMKKLFNRYHKTLARASRTEDDYSRLVMKQLEAQNCIGALQAALGCYLRACSSPALSKAILLEEHLPTLRQVAFAAGEAAIPWTLDSQSQTPLDLFI